MPVKANINTKTQKKGIFSHKKPSNFRKTLKYNQMEETHRKMDNPLVATSVRVIIIAPLRSNIRTLMKLKEPVPLSKSVMKKKKN